MDKKDTLIESLANGATITDACKGACINRSTYYLWKEDKAFRKLIEKAKDKRTEIVEDALFKQAEKGNTIAMIFWLKNRSSGKWADKHEFTGASDKTIINVVTTENKKTAVALDKTLRL